jgi:dTDP-4-dehydrorhamnose 3,5-epimerase
MLLICNYNSQSNDIALIIMDKRYKLLEIKDIIVFTPRKYDDTRGFFYENFNCKDFFKFSEYFFNIYQENVSVSKKNTLRGLHFQKGYSAQSKIINVIKGSILDVLIDIRPSSKTFSKWTSYILDDKLNESLFVPYGFAHGFLTLEEETIVSYKVDKPYNVNAECSIIWNDKTISIDWPIEEPLLSEKDKVALNFEDNKNLNNFVNG